jgi:hypothetical protein
MNYKFKVGQKVGVHPFSRDEGKDSPEVWVTHIFVGEVKRVSTYNNVPAYLVNPAGMGVMQWVLEPNLKEAE